MDENSELPPAAPLAVAATDLVDPLIDVLYRMHQVGFDEGWDAAICYAAHVAALDPARLQMLAAAAADHCREG